MKERFVKTLIRLLSQATRLARGERQPPKPQSVHRIVAFQMSGIGDLLLITPALRALHHLYPSARIDIVTYSLPNAAFLFRLPYVGEGCEFPIFDLRLSAIWRPAFWRALANAIRFMRREPTDLYVSFHHTWLPQWYLLELWLAARSGARFRVGINPDYVSGHGVFDRSVPESLLGERHYRAFFMDVVGLLGDPGKDVAIECPLTLQEIEEARSRVRRAMPARDRIICLHVGATHVAQLWPIDRFQALARRLEADGCGMVLLGTRDERPLTDQITSVLPTGSYLDAVGTTDLFQMAALIEVSHLFIGNDSGPMHIAISRRRPTIGLIGPGQPRYHFYDPQEAVILKNPVLGVATVCKDAVFPWAVKVDEVYEKARELLL